MLMNRLARFGFGGSTVFVASSGDPVSFNTTQQHQLQELLGSGCYSNFQSLTLVTEGLR